MAKIDRLLKRAREHFDLGEEAVASVLGVYEIKMLGGDTVRNGMLVATNRRLVFFAKKFGGFELEMFPYNNISSIEMGKNLLGHHISFFASGNKVKVKWIRQGNIQGFLKFVKSRISEVDAATEEISPPESVNPLEQIETLGKLHKASVISDSEFEAKKAELLQRI